jgi:electron transfer DM13
MRAPAASREGGLGRPSFPRRVGGFVSRHRKAVAAVSIAIVGLAVFGFLWFRPDKFFVNKTVSETLPTTTASAPAASAATSTVLSTGRFRDLEHHTTGVAKVVRLADRSRYVRFESFRTSSGPDVIVALSSIPATEDGWRAYDDGRFLSLGALKGNVGNQNYKIPVSVDLSKYRSVVVWCRRFVVGFGAAPL